ncbi:MAG: LysR family transcriptional regulator [Labilithrix sp.]|nr:LysR family transcriptional regulator [Labilithrix sp.]MCW5833472.1 LysR family transcriptional regulator [Labilithrix sp.]
MSKAATGLESLGSLRAFAHVAEVRSFVRAGRRLGLSASAVGKSVARLEEHLGVRLFHRTTRSLSLTVEGARFLERCGRILAELDGAATDFSRASDAPSGRLRVALPMASRFFSPLLADFARAHPRVELDVDFSDRLVDMVEEGFDVAIRTGTPSDSRLSTRRLRRFRHVIVGAPSYLARRPPPTTPSALAEHRLLLYRKPQSGKVEPWPVDREASPKRLGRAGGVVTNDIDALVEMAREGQGLACVPDYFVERELRDGTLVHVLPSAANGGNAFRLFWPSDAQRAARVRAFIEFMVTRLGPERGK